MSEETKKYVGIGMALGIVFGAVFGQAIFGNVGVAMGMIFGPVIGAALGMNRLVHLQRFYEPRVTHESCKA
jgi:xanthine/uracil permease